MSSRTNSGWARALCACLWLSGAAIPVGAAGPELTEYGERVLLRADGSASVFLSLTVARPGVNGIRIPVRHASLRGLDAQGPGPVGVRVREENGRRFIELAVPAAAPRPLTLRVSYEVEDYTGKTPGPRGLEYRFQNLTFGRIGSFRTFIALPEGYVVQTVGEFLPKPAKAGAPPPYALSRQGGRRGVRIFAADVGLGDEIALQATFRHSRRSKPLFLVLLAAALAYLVFYRDILKNSRKGGTGG